MCVVHRDSRASIGERHLTTELRYLHIVEEWTAAELAEHWGPPRGTVLSRIHRARAAQSDKLTTGGAAKQNTGGGLLFGGTRFAWTLPMKPVAEMSVVALSGGGEERG